MCVFYDIIFLGGIKCENALALIIGLFVFLLRKAKDSQSGVSEVLIALEFFLNI